MGLLLTELQKAQWDSPRHSFVPPSEDPYLILPERTRVGTCVEFIPKWLWAQEGD